MNKPSSFKDHASQTLSTLFRVCREITAIIIWIAISFQIFIIDIGDYLVNLFPVIERFFIYKSIIILSILALMWLILGNRRFFKFFVYILFYPFVLVLWKIPKLLLKNWPVVIAFLPASSQFLRAFKSNFIFSVIYLVSVFLVCVMPADSIFVPVGGALVATYLIRHFTIRFKHAYSSSTIFTEIKDIVSKIWQHTKNHIENSKPDEKLASNEYKQKFGEHLLQTYMLTTGLHFSTIKLQEVIASRKIDLYLICSLIWTFTLSVITFGIIYFSIFRMDMNHFEGPMPLDLIDFIGLSFTTIMTSSASNISPSSGLAQFITYLQLFTSLLIIVLLVFIVLTSIREKYKNDLDELVNELKIANDLALTYINENYDLTIEAIEHLLVMHNEHVMRLMLGVRYGKNKAESLIEQYKIDTSKTNETKGSTNG